MQYNLQHNDRLFPTGKTYLYKMMDKGCVKADLPKIRVHDLRQSHVSL